jgi:hypothetical protein
VEVITGRRRRRDWTVTEKAEIAAASAVAGASVSEVARRYRVNRALLSAWRRQAGLTRAGRSRGGGAGIGFIPIAVDGAGDGAPGRAGGGAGDGMITLAAGVRVLLWPKPVDFRKGHDGLAALV